MLIILNGVETIHESSLARKITQTLNTFTCGEYTIDLSGPNAKFVDADGNVVVEENDPNPDFGPTAEMIQGLNDLQAAIIEQSKVSHYSNIFEHILYDYGLYPTVDVTSPEYVADSPFHPHTYASVVEAYKTRPYEHHVISGIFSIEFIKRIRRSVGAANVITLNIVRNPSVCYLLIQKPEDAYQGTLQNRSEAMDKIKLERSICNAVLVKNLTNVTTLKFEDIIKDGGFDVNGVRVTLPVEFADYNGIISQTEKDGWGVRKHDMAGYLELFNQDYSAHELTIIVNHNGEHPDDDQTYPEDMAAWELRRLRDILYWYNREGGTSITPEYMDTLNKNMFTELGYQPLTYDDIVKPYDTEPQTV